MGRALGLGSGYSPVAPHDHWFHRSVQTGEHLTVTGFLLVSATPGQPVLPQSRTGTALKYLGAISNLSCGSLPVLFSNFACVNIPGSDHLPVSCPISVLSGVVLYRVYDPLVYLLRASSLPLLDLVFAVPEVSVLMLTRNCMVILLKLLTESSR